jgi:hypothetical protein
MGGSSPLFEEKEVDPSRILVVSATISSLRRLDSLYPGLIRNI